MYDPIARKFIINHDVQFMENDDIEDEVVQTPTTRQCIVLSTPGTVTQITTQNTLVRTTGAQSTPRAQHTPTINLSSCTSRDQTLASLLPR